MALFGAFDGFDKGSSGRRGKRKKNQHSDSEFRAKMDDPRAHAAHKAALSAWALLECVLREVGGLLSTDLRLQIDKTIVSVGLACQYTPFHISAEYRVALHTALQSSLLSPMPQREEDSGVLLQYAVPLASRAASADPSAEVRSVCKFTLKLCNAIMRPRTAPLMLREVVYSAEVNYLKELERAKESKEVEEKEDARMEAINAAADASAPHSEGAFHTTTPINSSGSSNPPQQQQQQLQSKQVMAEYQSNTVLSTQTTLPSDTLTRPAPASESQAASKGQAEDSTEVLLPAAKRQRTSEDAVTPLPTPTPAATAPSAASGASANATQMDVDGDAELSLQPPDEATGSLWSF
jgi:hypothetical protein